MSNYAGPITNIIVVMMENRSYDNILGGLYNSNNAPPYNEAPSGQLHLNGLTGTETNPNPNSPGNTIPVANQTTQTVDPNTGTSYPPTTIPIFDPGEPFDDMAQQILGLSAVPTSNPYAPSSTLYPPDAAHAMQGFTTNYAQLKHLDGDPIIPAANIPDVMNYFTPAQLPVTAWLANNFAVCDEWYASVPTHTFTNRAFAHCAAPGVAQASESYSLVDDPQYIWPFLDGTLVELPSIFSRLDAVYTDSAQGSPPNWKVYFHDYAISTLIAPYVNNCAASSENVNVATYDNSDWGTETPISIGVKLGAVPSTFMDDLNNNKLPMYSFIEPRYSRDWAYYVNPSNSNHPGGSSWYSNTPGPDSPPTDTANGEAFLAQLYNALQASNYWDKTLLIITYDEHGGTYDHVTPPKAVPPGGSIPPARNLLDPATDGFAFNVFGVRVPTIIVSPYVAQGSTINTTGATPFDHTSIIKTVWDCFNLSTASATSLTQRDLEAPGLLSSLSNNICNQTGQCPVTVPSPKSAPASSPTRSSTSDEEPAWQERLEKLMRGRRQAGKQN